MGQRGVLQRSLLVCAFAVVCVASVGWSGPSRAADSPKSFCPEGPVAAVGATSAEMARKLLNRGREHAKAGDPCAAERALTAAAGWPGERGAAMSELGALYEQAGRLDDAARAYAKALEANIGDRRARDRLLALRRQQATERAKTIMAEAEALQAQGKKEEAVRRYRDVLQVEPFHKVAVTRMADLLAELGKNKPAEKGYIRAISIDPEYEPAYTGLLNLRERIKQDALEQDRARARAATSDEKVAVYRRILRHYPNDREAWVKLAQTLMGLHRFDEAEDVLYKMLGRNRFDATANAMLKTLAKLRADAESHPDAAANRAPRRSETELRHALLANPENIQARLELADLLLASRHAAEATDEYRAVLALHPRSQPAHMGLGLAFVAQSRFEEAEAAYRSAIRINPFSADGHHGLGLALAMQGKYSGAELAFRDSIRLDPENPRAHGNLGLALELQQRLSEAEAAYQMAVDLAPSYKIAAANLTRLRKRSEGPSPGGFDMPKPSLADASGDVAAAQGKDNGGAESLPVSQEMRAAARQSVSWRRLVAKERALRASFEQANLELDVLERMRQAGKGEPTALDKAITEKKEELAAFSEMLIQVRQNRERFVGDSMSTDPPKTN